MVSQPWKKRCHSKTNQVSFEPLALKWNLRIGWNLTFRLCSNVVAATDLTLLALAGIGLRHGKVKTLFLVPSTMMSYSERSQSVLIEAAFRWHHKILRVYQNVPTFTMITKRFSSCNRIMHWYFCLIFFCNKCCASSLLDNLRSQCIQALSWWFRFIL